MLIQYSCNDCTLLYEICIIKELLFFYNALSIDIEYVFWVTIKEY